MVKNTRVAIIILIIFFITICNNRIAFSDEINISNNVNLEEEKINFESITMKDGLSSNAITCIFQDSKGYIWIGTEDGLNQYDGNSIVVYYYESGAENSLSSTYVTSIAEDENGYIWVGTYGGLNIIDSETEKVTSDINKDTLSNTYITAIYKDSNNIMWVGTDSGLNRYDSKNDKFIQYYWNEAEDLVANNYITDIDEDKNGYLWISTKCGIGGVNINDLNSYTKNFNSKNSNQIYSIDNNVNGDTWVASKGGIFKYNVLAETTNYYKVELDKSIENSIVTILCDTNDNIWFGTSDGLIEYNEESDTTNIYKKDLLYTNSLISNSIRCLYQDKSGVLWVGTDNGISILNTTQQFSNKINYVLNKINLSDSSIISIIEDKNNDLWIGTESNGIINFIIETEETVRYTYSYTDSNTLSSNKIKYIFEIDTNKFIVSTDRGVDIIYKDTREVERNVGNEPIDKYVTEILSIFKDGDILWIGTNQGFYKNDQGTEELINYNDNFKENGITNVIIEDIFQDERDEDILWLAGERYNGLIKFHKEEGVIKNYVVDGYENSISYDSINCILGDGNNNLWIGTESGLTKFNIESETFINYLEKDGLANDCINSIEIDNEGNLWLGTNNGLTKFNIEKNRFINFSEIDGIQGSNFNRGVSLKIECDQILFGTSSGVVYFNPIDISEESYEGEDVIIGKVMVNGELIKFDDKELTLEYNQNNIMFQYFLPDYGNLSGVNYLYKLEGVDDEWKYLNRGLFANYTLLSSGSYTFKVKAINNNGDITDETTLKFTINRPFWQSSMAIFIYIICAAIIAFYVWNHVEILRALVDKQMKELNNQLEENRKLYERSIKNERFKNDYFVNLSHELRTPINIILSVLQVINSLEKNDNLTRDKNNHYMDVIKKSSNNLLKIIGDIIDSSKIESGTYKINKQDDVDIVYLVEETAISMSDYIKEKGINLIIDPDIEEKVISCDPKEIERCIINLIGNAVKFTDNGGEIVVLIKESKDSVSISIEDNGIGISQDDQEFIFKRFEQGKNFNSTKVSSSGIGLTLVKYIVELHDGSVSLESEIDKGSRFTITLPVV